MDVVIGAYGSSYLEGGAAHLVYGTNTSTAYEASFLDLGGGAGGGLDGVDGFTLTGVMMQFPLYAELVRCPVLIKSPDKRTLPTVRFVMHSNRQVRGDRCRRTRRIQLKPGTTIGPEIQPRLHIRTHQRVATDSTR